ncbi:U5 small nuclear ribonucleoprotein [Histomonas meleagridis]|uniref:U5 small nuclear ribonucleoprotein helicase n=1 Tax=Histomonas meleagridis TaxID=135588 RepID=UPI00355A755E|nr:U5 small nuclear ribonucleoprotein [Histomonas meleagridis]KAH0802459.1 U5 small nuclear ribonucleoprotein helicase [Histomonas meleagridis]
MDGGAGAFQFKSYDYKNGEIMVLELADSVLKEIAEQKEGSNIRSLNGMIKKSDFGSAITSTSASYQKALMSEHKKQARKAKNKIKHEAAKRAQIYIPQTPETAQSYDMLTSIISDLVGGIPDDILHQTAYDLLRLLKSEGLTDEQRIQGIKQQLSVDVDPDTIAHLFSLAKEINDFTIDSSINLNEVDEDGIVAIAGSDDDDYYSSSSSDDEDEEPIDDVKIPLSVTGTGWDIEKVKEIFKEEFKDESDSKLDISLKLLQNEEGSRLETELARVIGFNKLDIVRNLVLNKESLIRKKEDNKELKKLDFSQLVFEQGSHFLSSDKVLLPEGTEKIDTEYYREIYVPFQTPPVDAEPLISIAELPDYVQSAFSSFTTLNRIQSKICKTALETDNNILVSAPTGAGKTNIALLCILREFHVRPESKVIYVAPMKSLVQEMVGSFTYRLQEYGKVVVELTGDSSASKSQLSKSDVIVTTPEKWDIITRKVGSRVLTEKVGLIIIDEIHLLHDERGPVLEAIVARMKRNADTTRQQIRFVGLSATMPNYDDIAHFLRVKEGLFVFDERYRPCPLHKRFIGVRNKSGLAAKREMNEICYNKILERIQTSQVLVFVHSRRETIDTVRNFIEKSMEQGNSEIFSSPNSRTADILADSVTRAHNNDLKNILTSGIAFHNAGLDADDRKLVESLFARGHVKVLVSTATLAWGVNLPAHTVIIKGTRVYSPERSQWENLSHLDVLQMFGRAGRPQYDTYGEGIIITELNELQYYISVLSQQMPIESHFLRDVSSHLNAEVSLGTITNLNDAAEWIGYTYLFIRMLKSPKLYGINEKDDISLRTRRLEIVHTAAIELDEKRLVRYDQKTGEIKPTELGRIASNFYISPDTMNKFAQFIRPYMNDVDIFRLFCVSSEFKNVVVRPEEKPEISKLLNHVPIPIKESNDDPSAKINVLLQCYICRIPLKGFSLMADMIYISQNAERIMRCMYEISLSFGWAQLSLNLLSYSKMIGARMWNVQSPLRQFKMVPSSIVAQLERKFFPWGNYFDLTPTRLGELAKSPKDGEFLAQIIRNFPRIKTSARAIPINSKILRVIIDISAEFDYDPEIHHDTEPFWVFCCDGDLNTILHSELFLLKSRYPQTTLSFIVTILQPIQPFYYVKIISDRWIPCEAEFNIPIISLNLPKPIPSSNFMKGNIEYPFQEFINCANNNPDKSIFVAAPPNTGRSVCIKTIIESSLSNNHKIAIIIPVYDKFKKLSQQYSSLYGFKVLTGDIDLDEKIIHESRLIIGTHSMFITYDHFDTVILFDLHLIGDEDYIDYEILISTMKFLGCVTRFVGISSCILDPKSLGLWINCDPKFIFAFTPDMRKIQFKIQTFNFPTSRSRLMSMSRPLFTTIKDSNTSIIFVPNNQQMYQTAFELINYSSILGNDKLFSRGEPPLFKDGTLNQISQYGISLFHTNLSDYDKELITDNLGQSIGCIICVIDCVWELNISADIVVMKGTDYYDGITHNHIEYSIYNIIECMGYTLDNGTFVLFTHTPRKLFYLTFLTEPLPIESNFDRISQIAFNNIMALGIAHTKNDLIKYVTNTYFYQRIIRNPSYYGIMVNTQQGISDYVSDLIDNSVDELKSFNAIEENEDNFTLNILPLGQISTTCYVDPSTIELIAGSLTKDTAHKGILQLICSSTEFSTIQIKSPKTINNLSNHFPDLLIEPNDPSSYVNLIFRCYMYRIPIPEELYINFREMSITFLRVINAVIQIAAICNWLKPAIAAIQLNQRFVQTIGFDQSELLQMPFITQNIAEKCIANGIVTVNDLRDKGSDENGDVYCKQLLEINPNEEYKWTAICNAANRYPSINLAARKVGNNTVEAMLERDIDEDENVGLVLAPNFCLRKSENWWVVLVDGGENLIDIQKVAFERKILVTFEVSPEMMALPLRMFALCDSYIGCDLACDIN